MENDHLISKLTLKNITEHKKSPNTCGNTQNKTLSQTIILWISIWSQTIQTRCHCSE